MDSAEIKSKIWNGSVNIRIVLPSTNSEDSYYLTHLYRNSYFPIHYPQIIAYFQHFDDRASTQPLWLEYEGVPLKWNLPIGVLHDYLYLPSRKSNVWTLTLHLDPFPVEHIIPFVYKVPRPPGSVIDYEKTVKEVLMNQLKQSCFVINGSSKIIMNLSEGDSNRLWHSIKSHNLLQYDTVNKQVLPLNKYHRIPVKIYLCGSTDVIQVPIYPQRDGDSKISVALGDVLRKCLPKLFTLEKSYATPYIHGINVGGLIDDAESSVLELWKVFKHLDSFLYVIVTVT